MKNKLISTDSKLTIFQILWNKRRAIGILLLLVVGLTTRATAQNIILFENVNFGGQSVTLTQSTPDLGNFDNQASSVIVVNGVWMLYRNNNYEETADRPSIVLTPGNYVNLEDVNFLRRRLSSVRFMGEDVYGPKPLDCPPPYRVVGADGKCDWSCASGTMPGPEKECICKSGLFEVGRDDLGRRICSDGKLAPLQEVKPDDTRGTVSLPSCKGPYHVALPRDGKIVCLWNCGTGTVPDERSGECVCAPDMVEAGIDEYGRRYCEARQTNFSEYEFYEVGFSEAIAVAHINGFTFSEQPSVDPSLIESLFGTVAYCERSGNRFTGHSTNDDRVSCKFKLFGGRELADGWSFWRFEAHQTTRAYLDFDFIETTDGPGYTLVFQENNNSVDQVDGDSIILRGPPRSDWHDAFK